MKRILVENLHLEYRDLPAQCEHRPVLVMLHEGLGCVAMWRQFPDRLAAATGCRVVAYSRGGYGHSDAYIAPRQADYLHREAQQMLPAFLAALNIERPILVGHSDGASVALIHAGSFVDAVCGLAVIAPHEFVELETLAGIRVAQQLWRTAAWHDRLARHHRDPERVFREWSETWLDPAFHGWNIEAYLQKIRCPVVAMQGENDEYASMRQVEVIPQHIPGAQLCKLPACGHSPFKDRPDQVAALIAQFVESCVEKTAS